MRTPVLAAIFILAAAATPSFAQHIGPPRRSISSFPSAHEAHFPRTVYLGSPLWFDDYAPRDSASPQVIVVQTPAPPPPSAHPMFDQRKPADPLLIEWQGDRYVRRTSGSPGDAKPLPLDYAAPANPHPPRAIPPVPPASVAAHVPVEPAPATFIFRDGHREQSSDYTIASGIIYTRGDYWITGSWSRKIPIAQLDVPATLRANAGNGVPFRLPSAPNEIIIRP